MALIFDVVTNNKLIPIASKSSNIDINSIFISTTDDVFISLYPNNSNDCDFDDFNNKIIFGASNIYNKNQLEAYISSSSKNNKIIRFNDYNIITNVDILPFSLSNISLGNKKNKFNKLFISSNINISNLNINSYQSNIYINDFLVNNTNILNTIITSIINTSNISTSILTTDKAIIKYNIYNNTIISDKLYTSNIKSYGNIYTKNLNNLNNIYTSNFITSNLISYQSLNISNISTSNININNILNSINVSNYNTITTKELIARDYSRLNNLTIAANLLPNSNNIYDLGTYNNRWCNIYINSIIFSDNCSLSNINSDLYTNEIFNANKIYTNSINTAVPTNITIYNNLYSYDGVIISGKILNTNLIKTNSIISSNIYVLQDLFTSNINTDNIYANVIKTSNITVLSLTYSSNILTDNINTNNLYIINLNSSNLNINNFIANNSAYINNIKLYGSLLNLKDNNNDIGSISKKWNNLYITSNININNVSIYSYNNALNINDNININNLYTSNIKAKNINIVNNINTISLLSSCNINNISSITTNNIYTSNLINYNNIKTNQIYYTIDVISSNLYTSNLFIENEAIINNIISKNIYSSNDIYQNISNNHNIIIKNLNISNLANLNKIIFSSDVISLNDSEYSLGTYEKKWKDLYIADYSLYLGSNIINSSNKTLNIFNNNYTAYQSITIKKIILKNTINSYGSIYINNSNNLSFSSDSNSTLDYNLLKDIPFTSKINNSYISYSNFIINNIFNSNALFFNNVSINSINNPNTLYINGNIIASQLKSKYIGNFNNVSNIKSTNIINKLPSYSGGVELNYKSSNISYILNNFIIRDKLSTKNINSLYYYGNAYNISNIYTSNLINNLSLSNYGTGNTFFNNTNILFGNSSNNILTSQNFKFTNSNLIINGTIITSDLNTDTFTIYSSSFQGNASNITNIISSNICINNTDKIATSNGGILNNVSSNIKLLINNQKNTLFVDNKIKVNNIYSSYYYGDGNNISNIRTSNIKGTIKYENGGLNYNNIFGTSNIIWNNTLNNNKLTVNQNLYANNLISYYKGNAVNISNININNISNILPIILGGTNNSNFNNNELLYYNGVYITSSSNLYWSNNTLNIKGSLNISSISTSLLYGNAINLSNINANSINPNINNTLLQNGGTNNNYFNENAVIFNDLYKFDTDTIFKFINNKLIILGTIINNNSYSSNYNGDAYNISNIISSNIINKLSILNGGTGLTNINKNNIIVGGNNILILNNNFNYNNITKTLNVNDIDITNINTNTLLYSSNINGNFIGDAYNISNINLTNIDNTSVLSQSLGGTGTSFNSKYNILLYPNIQYIINDFNQSQNIFKINSNLYSDIFSSSNYYGNGFNISNIYSSNITNVLKPSNGGLTNYINQNNLNWVNNNIIINSTNGVNSKILSKTINSIYYGNAFNISNIISSNLINSLTNVNGSITNSLYLKNNINYFGNINNITLNLSNIYSIKINSIYYGNANNISNIIINKGIVSIKNGGLGLDNSLLNNSYNKILYGSSISSSNIEFTDKLYYKSSILYINSNLYANAVMSKYYGNGINISNIISSNIKGTLNVNNGGIITNFNNIISSISSCNLNWNNNTLSLLNGGLLQTDNIYSKYYYGDGLNISNINAEDIINILQKNNGGFDNLNFNNSNINWDNISNILNINGNIISYNIQSKLIGDGINISNINAQNIINTLLTNNGGIQNTNIPLYRILFGNNTNDNLLWNNINNRLIINGDIVSKDIYGNYIGDALNISNIITNNISIVNPLSVINGGLGCNTINYGNLLVGNNNTISTPYIIWDNNTLYTNDISINGTFNIAKLISLQNKNINISNIFTSNVIGITNVFNGGIGNNYINSTYLLYGSDNTNNPLSSNILLRFNSNLHTQNIYTNNINSSNIILKDIKTSSIQSSNFIGDGYLISNINTNKFNNNILKTGGTGYSNLIYGSLLNSTISQYLNWCNNTLYANNILSKDIIASYYYGNGYNISNISFTNLILELNVIFGGFNCNTIPYGNILFGNNENTIITNSNLLFINDNIIITGDIVSCNYNATFYGNNYTDYNNSITNLSILSSNMTGFINYTQGGLNKDYIDTRYLSDAIYFSSNNNIHITNKLKWSSNNLYVDGNIITNNYKGTFISSNVLGLVDIINGGFNSNIIEKEFIIIGNNNGVKISSNLLFKNDNLFTSNILATRLFADDFKGDAYNISNILANNLYNYLSIINGGIGSNTLKNGSILVGSDTSYLGNNNIFWLNNILYIDGDTKINTPVQSYFIGNGVNISNIDIVNNFNQANDLKNGCTSKNYFNSGNILYGNRSFGINNTSVLIWNNSNSILNINGDLYATLLSVSNVFNIVASNSIGELKTQQGGTGYNNISYHNLLVGNGYSDNNKLITTNNLIYINKNTSNFITNTSNLINNLIIKGKISDYNGYINSLFVGDGKNISNIVSSNFNGITFLYNGGLGKNNFDLNNILYGDGINNIKYNSNLLFDENLYIKNINSKKINGEYIIGDGYNISNYNPEFIIGVIDIINGGLNCNTLPLGSLLIGNKDTIITPNKINWQNNKLTIYDGSIDVSKDIINNLYIGDGTNIVSIFNSNIINQVDVINGGFSCNIIPSGNIIIGNSNSILVSSNILWNVINNNINDINNNLIINDNINVININNKLLVSKDLQSLYIGNALNISNYMSSNIVYYTGVKNGGIGHNYIPKGYLIVGNNSDSLIITSNLYFNDSNLHSKNTITNKNIYTKRLYGDGQNISNYTFYVSNMIPSDIIRVLNGALGSNIHNLNQIMFGNKYDPIISTSNLYWDGNNLTIYDYLMAENLNIKGGIVGLSYQGSFYGDGIGLSNIVGSNIIDAIPVVNQGTGYSNSINKGQLLVGNNTSAIITTSDLTFDTTSILFSVKGTFNATTMSVTLNTNASNIITSNNIIITNKSIYNEIYGNNIFTSNIKGDGLDLSNINIRNVRGLTLNVKNGGFSCNSIPLNSILIGNDNNIYIDNNFNWNSNDNILNIIYGSLKTKDIYASNIYNKNTYSERYIGDATYLSNIPLSYIIGELPVNYGGTGCNAILKGSLLIGNNSNGGILTTSNVYFNNTTRELSVAGLINTVTVSSVTINTYDILNSNLLSVNKSIHNNLYSDRIQSLYIGDGAELSNINISNLSAITLLNKYGGTGSNTLSKGKILIGNNENPLILSDEISFTNDNNLIIKGNINNYSNNINISVLKTNKIYGRGKYYGDATNISNIPLNKIIDTVQVKYGGTGSNYIEKGLILVGNSSNAIFTSSNLYRNIVTNDLYVNDSIIFKTLSTNTLYTSNIYSSNTASLNKSYHNTIYSQLIQGGYTGDGSGLSNVYVDLFKNLILNIENGGFGCNILPEGCLLIGNDNNIITTSNLLYSNSILTVNNNIIANNILANNIYSKDLQGQLYGDASHMSNININNVANVLLYTYNGGTGYKKIDEGCILFGDINTDIAYSSNLLWNNNAKFLYINSNIYSLYKSTNNITTNGLSTYNLNVNQKNNINNISFNSNIFSKYIKSGYYGDAENISNIVASNIYGILKTDFGCTNCNSIPLNCLLIGNDNNSITSLSNIILNNNTLYVNGNINTNNLYNNEIYTRNTYTSYLYGDGSGLSNINIYNISGSLSVLASGTGLNNIPYGQLLVGNGTSNVITTSNLYWNVSTNSLFVNGRTTTNTSLSTVTASTSNIITNNIIVNGTFINNNTVSDYIQGGFYGNGMNISNIKLTNNNFNNVKGVINSLYGGTGCNIIPFGNIVMGNNGNTISTINNLNWNNNLLTVNGNIKVSSNLNIENIGSSTIYSYNYIGDGANISNLSAANFVGVFSVITGGIGTNYIDSGRLLVGNGINQSVITTSNLYYNSSILNINGDIKTSINVVNNITLSSSNIIASNLTNNTNLSTFNNVIAPYIQTGLKGDGFDLSNINRFNNILSISNGGTGNSILNGGTLLIGNNANSVINSSNILMNENNLVINSNIIGLSNVNFLSLYGNNIYSSNFIGDGTNISNIRINNLLGALSVSKSGTGLTNINRGYILVGSNTNPINISSNLRWDIDTNILYNYNNLTTTTVSSTTYNLFYATTCNIVCQNSVFSNLYSARIQGLFKGDGYNLSNINFNNLIKSGNELYSHTSNNITFGNIIIGGNKKNIIVSSNLAWYNNKLYGSNIITNNLISYDNNANDIQLSSNIYINYKYKIITPFYISLYISSSSSINNYVPFDVDYTKSIQNIGSYNWTDNHFISKLKGIYSFDYSLSTDTTSYMWINRTNDFITNDNKFGLRYISEGGSINSIVNSDINDEWYFSLNGTGNILVNNNLGITKASIVLLQNIV